MKAQVNKSEGQRDVAAETTEMTKIVPYYFNMLAALTEPMAWSIVKKIDLHGL